MSPPDLIVDMTWCNPRDLILLFSPTSASGNHGYFDEPLIAKHLDKYSQDSWNEKIEELNVEYAPAELQSLKKVLINFREYFKMLDYDMHLARRADMDSNIANFASRRPSSKVLEDLYRIGVLGQSHRKPQHTGLGVRQFEEHWAYRGDNSFDPAAWMVVHKALWKHLRLKDIWSNR